MRYGDVIPEGRTEEAKISWAWKNEWRATVFTP